MKWKIEYRCSECRSVLSYKEVIYSLGMCPCCGFKHPFAVTVVNVTEHPYRLVKEGKWWQFWIPRKRVYR